MSIYKKIIVSLVLCVVGISNTYAGEKRILRLCEGEGCACTHDKKLRTSTILYSDVNVHSKIVAKLEANTPAELVGPVTIVNNPGRAIITNVFLSSGLPVKIGDEINLIWDNGEGFYDAEYNGHRFDFSYEDQLTYSVIEASDYKTWYEIKSGKFHGFAENFPFEGCLE